MRSASPSPSRSRVVRTLVAVAALVGATGAAAAVAATAATAAQDAGPFSLPPGALLELEPQRPRWLLVEPTRRLGLDHDETLPPEENGRRLQGAVAGLVPGDRLAVGAGTWVLPSTLRIEVSGRADAPVSLVAAEPGAVTLTTSPDHNVVHVGPFEDGAGRVSHVRLEGLELTGGSIGLRVYAADHVALEGLHVHHTGGAAVTANTRDNEGLWIARNRIHHTDGYGEGLYLGRDDDGGSAALSRSWIVQNHVHHTAGEQGDGIELKQGSWGNVLWGNRVHDTAGPCLTLYGTGGRDPNLVVGNALADAGDHVLQVQGEAIVMFNRLSGGRTGIFSADHRDTSRDLGLRGNVVLNPGGIALDVSGWRDREGLLEFDNVLVGEARRP